MGSVSDCCQPQGCPLAHLEQIECWIKYPLDDLLQKLLKDSVLVDASFIHPKVIDKLHSDHALHGMLGKLPELFIAILPRKNFNCEERRFRKTRSLIMQVRTPARRRTHLMDMASHSLAQGDCPQEDRESDGVN